MEFEENIKESPDRTWNSERLSDVSGFPPGIRELQDKEDAEAAWRPGDRDQEALSQPENQGAEGRPSDTEPRLRKDAHGWGGCRDCCECGEIKPEPPALLKRAVPAPVERHGCSDRGSGCGGMG